MNGLAQLLSSLRRFSAPLHSRQIDRVLAKILRIVPDVSKDHTHVVDNHCTRGKLLVMEYDNEGMKDFVQGLG